MDNKSKKVLYSVATNSEKELVNAKDAIKGNEYYCPVCDAPLILRKSGNSGKNSKRPHFAHKILTPNCTPETALHYIFKTQIYHKIKSLLEKERSLEFQWDCKFCKQIHKGDLLKRISNPDTVNICYNPKCQVCGNYMVKLYLYTNESSCYRCNSKLKYAYVASQTGSQVRGGSNHETPSGFTKEEISLARSKEVFLTKRYSKTSNYTYLANTCKNCNTFIGNHYLFGDYISQEHYDIEEANKHFVGYQCDHCITQQLKKGGGY